MPTYLITITVLAATEKDYKKLSQEMENKLFQLPLNPILVALLEKLADLLLSVL